MGVDPHAERGFGSGADDYDRHRPGWPPEAVERALTELGLGEDSTVVDLAAGTGKLTRELLPRTGHVVAIEPSADMRRRLSEVVPDAEPVDGAADAMPLGDGSANAVFVGEAFHWFATPEAGAEIGRVVRAGGGVALFWNLHDFGAEPWLEEVGGVLAPILAPAMAAVNRHRPDNWQSAFDDAPFGAFEQYDVPHEQHTDVDGLIAHVLTWSHTRALEAETRAKLTRDLDEVLRREHPTPDDVVIPYRTQVHWARRR